MLELVLFQTSLRKGTKQRRPMHEFNSVLLSVCAKCFLFSLCHTLMILELHKNVTNKTCEECCNPPPLTDVDTTEGLQTQTSRKKYNKYNYSCVFKNTLGIK